MAIVQISKIQNRRGLQQDLPQLDSGEIGWSIDTRQLFIGNGTLAEGAPVIGNTEIVMPPAFSLSACRCRRAASFSVVTIILSGTLQLS